MIGRDAFKVIALDRRGDRESWGTVCVLGFEEDVRAMEHDEDAPDCLSENQMREITEAAIAGGFVILSDGNGGAGQAFADEVWEQIYSHTIILSQRGGMDV